MMLHGASPSLGLSDVVFFFSGALQKDPTKCCCSSVYGSGHLRKQPTPYCTIHLKVLKSSNYQPASTGEMTNPPNKIIFFLLHLAAAEPTGTRTLLFYSCTIYARKPPFPASLPSAGAAPRVGSGAFLRRALLCQPTWCSYGSSLTFERCRQRGPPWRGFAYGAGTFTGSS